MTSKRPLVSVIIPTRNRPAELRRAIQSVVHQTYRPLELIVVHQESPEIEIALEIARKAGFTPKAIEMANNHANASENRNAGMSAASGYYCAFLDDDDVWLPNKIESQVKEMGANPSLSVVSCDYSIIKKGIEVHQVRTSANKSQEGNLSLWMSNVLGSCSFVIAKREQILAVGGFDEDLPSAQDWDLWVRLISRFGPFSIVPEVLVNYSEDSYPRISGSRWKRTRGYMAFVVKHRSSMSIPLIGFHVLRIAGTLLNGFPGLEPLAKRIGAGSRSILKRRFGLGYEFQKQESSSKNG